MSDPLMRGVIDAGKRHKGWMTSADCFDAEKLKQIGRDGAELMKRLVAEYNESKKMTPATFKRIRTERLRLTQSELAAVLRVEDLRTIRRWETGERPISGPVTYLMELLDEGKI